MNKRDQSKSTSYQPKTGEKCHCKRGVARDNCPECEGTGWRIDFRAIRARTAILKAEGKPGLGLIAAACRPDYHAPKPPQSCADLPQHLTFDGEPSYTDERE